MAHPAPDLDPTAEPAFGVTSAVSVPDEGPGPAGSSFREPDRPRSTQSRGGGSCSLSPTGGSAAELDQIGLLRHGEVVLDAAVDVGLADPPAHRLDRHIEVSGHLRHGQVTPAGHRDDLPLNSAGTVLGTATSFPPGSPGRKRCQPNPRQTPWSL